MADYNYHDTSYLTSDQMGEAVESMMRVAEDSRRNYARRWYDNNFFDDGYHFRYMSRTTNKIVDLSERQSVYNPLRAIPKASRQIRGVVNLLLASDPTPVIYPEKVDSSKYPQQPVYDEQSQQQQMMENPEFQRAKDEAKRIARLTGKWMEEEFKEQELMEKLALMALLATKHGVSYMQIYADSVREEIRTDVYDAFDIYLMGGMTSIYDSPFIIKGIPQLLSQIKANELFDQGQRDKISPDNRLASSDIKDAYLNMRFGTGHTAESSNSVILKEAYIKEYLNDDNWKRISMQEDGSEILKGKKEGDQVIRQVFSAGNIWLKDTYVKLPDYPFVDFRMEPGPIYHVPLIERFIPSNKSLDLITSRIERYTHTMVTGAWKVAESEGNLNITNQSGGQIIKYKAIPPEQANIAPIPAFVFNFISYLNNTIEEQGVTTTTLGKIPAGVKSGTAIESLKESEYANLVVASRRLKMTIKRIAEKLLDLADDNFIRPKTIQYMERGEPQFFDVIGSSALQKREQLKVDEEPLDAIPLKREYRVDIEIQSGAAYTREGRKEAAKQLMADMMPFIQGGFLPPEAIKAMIEKYLEMSEFGATDEIMEALDKHADTGNLTEQQLQAIKVAVIEVMKDLIKQKILPDQETRVEEAKVGAAEAIRDTGLADKEPQTDPIEQEKAMQEMQHKQEKHDLQMSQMQKKEQLTEEQVQEKQKLEEVKTIADIANKQEMTKAQVKAIKKGGNNAATDRKKPKDNK